ncbi:MAG: enoyl-CoA hydratase/isomerase family protein [Rhizobiales bacterium]|nr:enoyl-CoA hydratase/isomerase family protein [Hyphomicrobiales bacterium]
MTMLNDHCAVERRGQGVVRLTISNAGKSNILGSPVIAALTAGLAELAGERDLRALILTGAGETSFIGGADIKEMAGLEPASAERFIMGLRDLCEAVRRFPAPVAARIGGWCLGGGLELAMACDMRIAAETAKFAMPEVKVGIPSVIHAALMPRLIGAGRARWLLLTGATIDARTALDWGLVDVIASPGDLDAAVDQALAPVLACGPEAIRAQKALLRQFEELPLSQAIAASVPVFGQAFATGEPQAHMQAFLARKR